MDEADEAQRVAELFQQHAHRRHMPSAPALVTTECIGCGDPIPVDRALAAPGAVRCTDCQTLAERKAR